MTSFQYVVSKPLPAKDGTIPSGTVVDATGWRNVEKLVQGRYLRPATPADLEAAKKPTKTGKKEGQASGN